MMVFIFTFAVVFISLVLIIGLIGMAAGRNTGRQEQPEGEMTAAMCTTQLFEYTCGHEPTASDDFVIEQDMVYTYDSLIL